MSIPLYVILHINKPLLTSLVVVCGGKQSFSGTRLWLVVEDYLLNLPVPQGKGLEFRSASPTGACATYVLDFQIFIGTSYKVRVECCEGFMYYPSHGVSNQTPPPFGVQPDLGSLCMCHPPPAVQPPAFMPY